MGESHVFNVHVAEKYGINEAIMIHHFQYWISYNKRMKKNFIENRTWSYQTIEEVAGHFPYWSKKQVERLLTKLVKLEILSKNNFNKNPNDRTLWYAFVNESIFIEDSIEISRNREMEIPKSGNVYKDNKTDIYKENKIKEKTGATAPLASNEAHISSSYSYDNDIEECFDLLCKSLRHLKADYKISSYQIITWCNDIDKIIRLDKRKIEDLKQILVWLPQCRFWAKNIKSGKKLRKHFDDLWIEMMDKSCNNNDLNENHSFLLKLMDHLIKRYERDVVKINGLKLTQEVFEDKSKNLSILLSKSKIEILDFIKTNYQEFKI